MQTDWGGEYEKLMASFKKLASLIMFHALMLINKMALLKENIII
jgi:hypothetical protein